MKRTDKQIEAIMEQAQVFASAWSLVGGPFDSGAMLETAEQEKATLRTLLASEPAGATEKIAPVQGYTPGIPWSLHLEAYDAYSKRWAPQPAMIDLEGRNCRGGFSTGELDKFIPGWRDRVSEIGKLKARVAELEVQAAAPAQSDSAWHIGDPPTKAADYAEYIVAVRRKHAPEKVFVLSANYANEYIDDNEDEEQKPRTGWYMQAADMSGEYSYVYEKLLSEGDEVIGWQPLPKWSDTPAQKEPVAWPDENSAEFKAACSMALKASEAGVGPCGVFMAGYRTLRGISVDVGAAVADVHPTQTEPVLSDELHPDTAKLIRRFARALGNKLLAAQRKYGYGNSWLDDDWQNKCREELLRHITKGDPRDVAAYCAFMWHHDWSTAPTSPDGAPADAPKHDQIACSLVNGRGTKCTCDAFDPPASVGEARQAFGLALREYAAECNTCQDASKMDAARDRVLELYDRAALTQSEPAQTAQSEDPLTCDFCGAATDDPWHTSGIIERHLHQCDACRSARPSLKERPMTDEARDAARYRWLRQQHWNEAEMFVVAGSKSQVRLGADCPSLVRLDDIIDAALTVAQPASRDAT